MDGAVPPLIRVDDDGELRRVGPSLPRRAQQFAQSPAAVNQLDVALQRVLRVGRQLLGEGLRL